MNGFWKIKVLFGVESIREYQPKTLIKIFILNNWARRVFLSDKINK